MKRGVGYFLQGSVCSCEWVRFNCTGGRWAVKPEDRKAQWISTSAPPPTPKGGVDNHEWKSWPRFPCFSPHFVPLAPLFPVADPSCSDQHHNCMVVVPARLCVNAYCRSACCSSRSRPLRSCPSSLLKDHVRRWRAAVRPSVRRATARSLSAGGRVQVRPKTPRKLLSSVYEWGWMMTCARGQKSIVHLPL